MFEAVRSHGSADPTLVEFSGGLDSSLVLSAAVAVARRDGTPLPVPVTLRFSAAESDEHQYQEAVIRHLGLRQWLILSDDAHVDYLSDESRSELRRWGLQTSARIPARAWWLEQVRERFGSGLVLSGEGGDEVFGPGPWAPVFRLGRALATRTNVRSTVRWATAWAMSQARPERRRGHFQPPAYLTPRAVDLVWEGLNDTSGPRVFTVSKQLARSRSRQVVLDVLSDLSTQASRFGFTYRAPLLDLRFVGTLAQLPQSHFIDRNYFFEKHFSSLLPEVLLRRKTKAAFRDACFGPESKRFAVAWDGTGVPTDLVDVERLRQCWREGSDARSSLLLQHAWLASGGLV